ncbi:MAG: OadG family protein [Oscillospiraceae bacterium]
MPTLTNVAASGTKMAIGDAGVAAVLGYAVVFLGLVLLMAVIMIMGKIMVARGKKASAATAEAAAPAAPAEETQVYEPQAPGSAGDIKLYDTDPRDAAIIMAIVAEEMGKPLNELRFISIKEVK